jgi:hypothetical protein
MRKNSVRNISLNVVTAGFEALLSGNKFFYASLKEVSRPATF